jgi:glycosyltransferase involved in cell wall biosynthesis
MSPASSRRKLISIITPCYNEADNVEDCCVAISNLFAGELAAYDYEHIFCDNASTDATPEILRKLAAADKHVKVILNARNFGPFRSDFNGLMSASGDAILVFLAADQQDPPEVIPEMVRRWETGIEVVYGIRANREEGPIMRTTRRLYYRLVRRFAEIDIPPDAGEFQLVDRRIADELRKVDDYYPYIRGLIANCGFRREGVPYTWKARRKGLSKNRLYHLFDQGLNGLISFTNVPMRLCLLAGVIISLLSTVAAVLSAAVNLFYFRRLAPPGIPTLIVAVFFFGGVQLFFLGVLGEYLSAIHGQVRQRPLVIERERMNFDQAPSGQNKTAP